MPSLLLLPYFLLAAILAAIGGAVFWASASILSGTCSFREDSVEQCLQDGVFEHRLGLAAYAGMGLTVLGFVVLVTAIWLGARKSWAEVPTMYGVHRVARDVLVTSSLTIVGYILLAGAIYMGVMALD